MAVTTTSFTTGPATLPDVGRLSYNGCQFSPLFESNVSGVAVKDEARRTVKYMEYTISVDGYVTLPVDAFDIAPTMETLRKLLTAQGGLLIYTGRGCDILVNAAGAGVKDAAWGPVPELLEFQPLGGGRSAKVRWTVKTCIPEIKAKTQAAGGYSLTSALTGGRVRLAGLAATPLLQFNYETNLNYPEDGFSSMTVNGILEIPLTRDPNQKTRSVTQTADNYREIIEARVMNGIDFARFHVTDRTFHLSRDKRTLEWSFKIEEKPYMDLPPGCTIARGTYSVRPSKAGAGLVNWLCTLRATYIVRGPFREGDPNAVPRRQAWVNFLALLRLRMASSQSVDIPQVQNGNQNPAPQRANLKTILVAPFRSMLAGTRKLLETQDKQVASSRNAWLVDFSFEEGLYLDSKTVSFSATWRLVVPFSHILLASGIWKKLPERDAQGNNLWATSIRAVSGAQSWLENRADPKLDIIVDFGGG